MAWSAPNSLLDTDVRIGASGRYTPIEIRGTTRTIGFDINNRRQVVASSFAACNPPDQQADAAQPVGTAVAIDS